MSNLFTILQVNITLTGNFIGKTALKVHLLSMDETMDADRFLYEIEKVNTILFASNHYNITILKLLM